MSDLSATQIRTAPYMQMLAEQNIHQSKLVLEEGYVKAVKVEIHQRSSEHYAIIYYSDGSEHAMDLPEEFIPSGWMNPKQAIDKFAKWVRH